MGAPGAEPRQVAALRRVWDAPVNGLDLEALASKTDAVFLALPDHAAAEIAPVLVERGTRVFDLSGAFRLRDAALRRRWYPKTPDSTRPAVYGLTEHNRERLRDSTFVACAGCYPTAAILSLKPLLGSGLLTTAAPIIIDAKSGVSGAGKTPSERTHFSEIHGSMAAYGVFNHRHGAEIEQGAGRMVTFTPHLLPLDRGILATIYVRVAPGTTEEALGDVLEHAYAGATFVRLVGSSLPEIKHVAHTNFCDIGWRVDPSGRAILVSVIDNLLKGASGQAVQNMNVMLGLDERMALL
jgi:N-acetyl-gamma-glutamyl-phosphate reductase